MPFVCYRSINFNVTNNGKGILYVRFVNRGKPAIGSEEEANGNISMDVVYKDMGGAVIPVDEWSPIQQQVRMP